MRIHIVELLLRYVCACDNFILFFFSTLAHSSLSFCLSAYLFHVCMVHTLGKPTSTRAYERSVSSQFPAPVLRLNFRTPLHSSSRFFRFAPTLRPPSLLHFCSLVSSSSEPVVITIRMGFTEQMGADYITILKNKLK